MYGSSKKKDEIILSAAPEGSMILPPSRADVFTESVIREMTRLSLAHEAINLAQGFPDFPCPDELKKAACDAITGDYNQYAITWGAQDLRQAIARKVKGYNGIEADPETEITVTCGSTEAMMASMIALVNPGDEVIVPEPFYENYGPDAVISGAVPRHIPLGDGSRPLDEEAWKTAFSGKTRAVIINTPNNPTGKVFSKNELQFITDLCLEHDVIAITDEIYEHILYDGHRHVSIGSLAGMEDRTVTINSLSKTYSVTGWRVGYTVADTRLDCTHQEDPRFPHGRGTGSPPARRGCRTRPAFYVLRGAGPGLHHPSAGSLRRPEESGILLSASGRGVLYLHGHLRLLG